MNVGDLWAVGGDQRDILYIVYSTFGWEDDITVMWIDKDASVMLDGHVSCSRALRMDALLFSEVAREG